MEKMASENVFFMPCFSKGKVDFSGKRDYNNKMHKKVQTVI